MTFHQVAELTLPFLDLAPRILLSKPKHPSLCSIIINNWHYDSNHVLDRYKWLKHPIYLECCRKKTGLSKKNICQSFSAANNISKWFEWKANKFFQKCQAHHWSCYHMRLPRGVVLVQRLRLVIIMLYNSAIIGC